MHYINSKCTRRISSLYIGLIAYSCTREKLQWDGHMNTDLMKETRNIALCKFCIHSCMRYVWLYLQFMLLNIRIIVLFGCFQVNINLLLCNENMFVGFLEKFR